MSRIEERADVPFVVEVAGMTVDSHAAGKRCQCCTAGGCEQLTWARRMLAEHRANRQRRPVVPDARQSKENDMKWKTLKCDNSGPNCPQIAEADGMVHLRDSERPLEIASFTPEAFETLKRKIHDGEV